MLDGVVKVRKPRTYNSPATLANLDQRTREARLMRETRAELIAHVGGKPSATQTVLIERAVALTLQLAMMDAKQGRGGLTEYDTRTYLAWSNSLVRTMKALGLVGKAQQGPDLKGYLAARATAA